jgi:hypothetical protein
LFGNLINRLARQGREKLEISPYVPNYFAPGVDVDRYPEALKFLQNKFDFKVIERATSMGANLTNFQIPSEIEALERQRERDDGITIRMVTAADLPDLMPFIERYFGWDWRRHAQDYLLTARSKKRMRSVLYSD